MRKIRGRIARLDRRNSSKNANPRWRVTLDNGDSYLTGVDCAIAYGLGNPEFRDTLVEFTLEKPRTSNWQITHAVPV